VGSEAAPVSSIEIPDPVITWHAEESYPIKDDWHSEFRVEARVGDVVVFERRYTDNDWQSWDGHAYDLREAKEKATQALGERLANLLREDT
jgi:hypothetical protein